MLAEPDNRIGALIKSGQSDADIVTELYWSALTRPPTVEERSAMVNHIQDSKDRRKGLEDVVWALLNAKEFVLRR